MENKTSFNLEGAIASWRASVSAQEAIGVEQARELESHLREGVAGWIAKGLNDQEAFRVTAGRMGRAEKVAAEFAKEDGLAVWRVRFFWMILGMIALRVLGDFGMLMMTAPGALLVRMYFPLYTVWVAQLVVLIVLGWVFFAVRRRVARDGANWDARFIRLCGRRGRLAGGLMGLLLTGAFLKASGMVFLFKSLGVSEMGHVYKSGAYWSLLYPVALVVFAVMMAPRKSLKVGQVS